MLWDWVGRFVPEDECPSEADVVRSAAVPPELMDPKSAIEIHELAMRFLDAATYCQTADRRRIGLMTALIESLQKLY